MVALIILLALGITGAFANRPRVVFAGSSTISGWSTLARDFPEYEVVNAGVGGTQIADTLASADEAIVTKNPSIVVLYIGDNDLWAGKNAPAVFADAKELLDHLHAKLPSAKIVCVSVKPSPSRSAVKNRIEFFNELLRAECASREYLRFAGVYSLLLDASGKPDAKFFAPDMLHFNEAGYALLRDATVVHF